MEFQNNKKYIVIRDDTIACFDVKKGVTEKSLVNARDINMWIATKTIHGIVMKKSDILKLKQLRKKMEKSWTKSTNPTKIEKPISIKTIANPNSTLPEKTKREEMTIDIVKNTILYISINGCIFLTPSEFANLTYHVINNVQLESLKYKTGKQYITPSSAKKKIQIDLGLIKKIYTELINSGIKIPLYLKSKIDNIYRWQ
ncbi:MAG: hypothetical protein PHP14_01695 [Candidatus Pacebacteria bacterium]|nr:hypothetical protein [Candidatus Paceibacterota bacterium]